MKKNTDKKKKGKRLSVEEKHPQEVGAPHVSFSFKLIWELPEFWSFCLGFLATCMALAMLLVGYMGEAKVGHAFMKILTSHIMLGAPMGALEGAKFPILDFWVNVVFNSLITISIICYFNTLFSLSCKKLFHLPILHSTFQDIKGDAKRQKKTWARFGIPGVFAFVFIPMPMTGPVVGSLLARFVGLRYWGVLTTVIFASISSICAWGYAADVLEQYLGGRVLNIILWSIILVTIAVAGYAKYTAWQKRRQEKRIADALKSGEDDRYFYDAVNDDASKTYNSFPTDY